MFKPKKKLDEAKTEASRISKDKEEIARLKKQIELAESELDEAEEISEEDSEDEIIDDEEIEEIEETKPTKSKEVKSQEDNVVLTKDEIVSAIEFNLNRAYQLLQILKQ